MYHYYYMTRCAANQHGVSGAQLILVAAVKNGVYALGPSGEQSVPDGPSVTVRRTVNQERLPDHPSSRRPAGHWHRVNTCPASYVRFNTP
jgi:hypothetical protein